jgi:hypothetical protein
MLPSFIDLKICTIRHVIANVTAFYQSLKAFSNYVYDVFSINITTCSTISALAHKIYFTHYYSNDFNSCKLNNNLYKLINNSYYGL